MMKYLLLISILFIYSCGKGAKLERNINEVIKTEEKSNEEFTGPIKNNNRCREVILEDKPSRPDKDCFETTLQDELIRFNQVILTLGGTINDPYDYEKNTESYNQFLRDSGVEYFSAREFIYPGHKKYAKDCKVENLIPPKQCWYRSVNLLLTADKVRAFIDKPLYATSLYRPSCYNKKIGGALRSDHLRSAALDITFNGNIETKELAQTFIYNQMWSTDTIGLNKNISMSSGLTNISLGLGQNLIHIGLNSPHGRRLWFYSGFTKNESFPDRCW